MVERITPLLIRTGKLLLSQFSPDMFNTFAARPNFPWVPSPGRTFAEVPSGYLLWCRCTAELRVLVDEYTRQWQWPMHIN